MTNTVDSHNPNLIRNLVNHPVITHAYAPVLFATNQLAAPGRAWVGCQRLNGCEDAVANTGREPPKVLFRRAFKQDAIYASLAVDLRQILFKRTILKRLAAGALEPGHILRILRAFQQFLVILDREDDRHRLAFARDNLRFGKGCFHGSKFWMELRTIDSIMVK